MPSRLLLVPDFRSCLPTPVPQTDLFSCEFPPSGHTWSGLLRLLPAEAAAAGVEVVETAAADRTTLETGARAQRCPPVMTKARAAAAGAVRCLFLAEGCI